MSTAKQGASGLGLEAQQAAIDRHLAAVGGRLLGSYVEVESGKANDRPEMTKALAHCRATGATLVIAKLDRLSRNAHFLMGLRDAGVEIAICDMPDADRTMVGMMALFAEREREMTSQRTKDALAAAKRRGIKLGNPRLRAGDRASALHAARAKSGQAYRRAKDLMPFLVAAERAGCMTHGQKAEAMMNRGIKTPGGETTWTATTVRRVLRRVSHETGAPGSRD